MPRLEAILTGELSGPININLGYLNTHYLLFRTRITLVGKPDLKTYGRYFVPYCGRIFYNFLMLKGLI